MNKNSIYGKLAKQSGDFFENLIRSKCEEYYYKHIALIQKLPVEKKLINGKLIYAEKSTVDFTGFLFENGKHIAIEAKNVSNGSSFQLSRLKPHQCQYLNHVNRYKGVGYLIIGFISENQIAIIKINDALYDYIESTSAFKKGKQVYTKTLSIKKLKEIPGAEYRITTFADFRFLEGIK